MAEMGKYCKAYPAKRLREYSGWNEDCTNLQKTTKTQDGQEVTQQRTELHDDEIVYVQENYVVTDGIFNDENVIFEDATQEWKDFCRDVLDFKIPDFESSSQPDAASAGSASPQSD